MERFEAFTEGIEVRGAALRAFLAAVGPTAAPIRDIFRRQGIDHLERDGWYPHQAWLDAFALIAEHCGADVLQRIGRSIPGTAVFPDTMHDVPTALQAIDVAYHMNHRLDGIPMYDPSDGSMLAGIGHYRYEPVTDGAAQVICNAPYPCDFDRGLIAAVAETFAVPASVTVEHDDAGPECRKQDAECCVYDVRWTPR